MRRHFDFARENSGDRTGWRCQGHFDVDTGVVAYFDLINQAKVLNVDRQFGVVNRPDRLNHFCFQK